MPWPLIPIEETDRARLHLRRYALRSDCPANGYHHADVFLCDEAVIESHGSWYTLTIMDDVRDRPDWPTHCSCGYAFTPEDTSHILKRRIYRVVETGELLTINETRAGMVWESPWLADVDWKGDDGKSYTVRLPDGSDWAMDGPATSTGMRKAWTRTGTFPLVTVRPSIGAPGYHGWLTDGVLSDDLEGRTYEAK